MFVLWSADVLPHTDHSPYEQRSLTRRDCCRAGLCQFTTVAWSMLDVYPTQQGFGSASPSRPFFLSPIRGQKCSPTAQMRVQTSTPCSLATRYIWSVIFSTSVFLIGTLCVPSHSTNVTDFGS